MSDRWVGKCVAHIAHGVRCTNPAAEWNVGPPDFLPLCEFHEESLNDHYAIELLISDPQKYLNRNEPRYAAKVTPLPSVHGSVIYFLQRSDGLVKIGTTTNLKARRRDLEVGAGPLKLLGCLSGSYETEGRLHSEFAHLRKFGEWFDLTPELKSFIEESLTRESVNTVYNQDSETHIETGES